MHIFKLKKIYIEGIALFQNIIHYSEVQLKKIVEHYFMEI